MALTDFSSTSPFGAQLLLTALPPTTGKIVFVGNSTVTLTSSGATSDSGSSPDRPYSTIASAVSATLASRGDVIVVMPGHAETITTTVTPVAGSSIIGLGWGRLKPAFTLSGAIAGFTVSAANVYFKNFRIIGAASAVLSHIDVSADDFTAEDMDFDQAATPLLSIRVTTADRFTFKRCKWTGTGSGPDACIDLGTTAKANNFYIKDCIGMYSATTAKDLDQAFIQSSKKTGDGGIIDGLTVSGCVLTVIDFNSSTSAIGDGLIANVNAGFTGSITLANGLDQAGFVVMRNAMGSDAVAGTAGPGFYATTAS